MFTQAVGKESVSSAIVENVSAIAEKQNLCLVIAGIETEEQAAYIRKIATDPVGQGWLYGKPGAARDILAERPLDLVTPY